jgi:hypothetical protein
MNCPCGLTQEQLDLHPNLVGSNGRCTAAFADDTLNEDGTPKICDRPLGAHPHTLPGINILL